MEHWKFHRTNRPNIPPNLISRDGPTGAETEWTEDANISIAASQVVSTASRFQVKNVTWDGFFQFFWISKPSKPHENLFLGHGPENMKTEFYEVQYISIPDLEDPGFIEPFSSEKRYI